MKNRRKFDIIAKSRLPKDYSLEKLRNMQKILSERIQEVDTLTRIEKVCGIDLAYRYSKDGEYGIACAAVCDIDGKLIDRACIVTKIEFPYIPTLLSLRELRPMIMAYRRLNIKPDVVLVDGHGKAHPYRLGIAAHFGVVMKVPTVGCAKSLLYGELRDCNEDYCNIVDPETGDIIGRALKHYNKYVYVSVGNLITLETACRIVRSLLKTRSQMPIPILYAHKLCNEYKRRLEAGIESLDKYFR